MKRIFNVIWLVFDSTIGFFRCRAGLNSSMVSLLFLLFLVPVRATNIYYTLNTQNGLSSNNVYQMLQLPDGRLVIATEGKIDIYDGHNFRSIDLANASWTGLDKYDGATHLYVDGEDRLWIKGYRKVCCASLRTLDMLKTNINHQ